MKAQNLLCSPISQESYRAFDFVKDKVMNDELNWMRKVPSIHTPEPNTDLNLKEKWLLVEV